MRKCFKQLLLGLATLALVCGILPSAFAADTRYAIELDPCGGTLSSEMVVYTNEYGKLTSLPTPTMAGYTFSGWYTELVGGARVRSDTIFISDSTIYARWTPLPGATTATPEAEPEPDAGPGNYIGTVLVLGLAGALVLLVVAAGNG